MERKYIIDIYAELSEEDIGQELELNVEDGIEVRCQETGKVYTGVFIIKDLEEVKDIDEDDLK